MAGHFHLNTPLLESIGMSKRMGTTVYLKMENSQPAGSFKIRGIGHLCQKLASQSKGLVCSSGGNAGMATAYVARKMCVPAIIIVPSSTPQLVVQRLQDQGATVRIVGKVWDDANTEALRLADVEGLTYVSPFDHPLLCEAKCLGAKTVSEKAFEYSQSKELNIISELVTDQQALHAVETFLDEERVLVEMACGAALASVYSGVLHRLQKEGHLPIPLGPVVIIVCGGSGVDMQQLSQLKLKLQG